MLLLLLTQVNIAFASGRKAKALYQQGREAELDGEYDRALGLYSEASQEAPQTIRYLLAERRMRFVAGQAHVDAGYRFRGQGLYEEAIAEFQMAVSIDPASSVALQEHMRTTELYQEQQASVEALDKGLTLESLQSALETERFERADRIRSLTAPPDLEPLSTEPINLMLNEDAKVIFETIGKLAGINVLFDPAFTSSKINIQILNSTLTEALDYVSLLTTSFWKPLTHNAVFIASDNPNKRREFEDEVVKTLYLTNLALPQDLQDVTTAIRGVTDIRRMFVVNSMSAIVIRASRAKLAIAEKIIHDMDKPRPEVVIDVLVIETSSSNARKLGITPVTGGTSGLSLPLTFNGANTSGNGTESAGLPLNRLGDIGTGSWSTTLPGFMVSALFNSSDSDLLQSPRIRAADNTEADLRIGDRIPIATGSFQPGVGGVGINPLVNTQFTYTDVGVNVTMTPKIHANRDVSMAISIEISNVRDFRDIGGISQPVIGQRMIKHNIRIQEGEASVIGGLNQSQMFKTKAGVPFLGELPIIGRLFSEQEVQRTESEILLVLIPHIVRMPSIDKSNLRAFASGTDQKFEMRYVQDGSSKPALLPLAQLTETSVQDVEPLVVDTPSQQVIDTQQEVDTAEPRATQDQQSVSDPLPQSQSSVGLALILDRASIDLGVGDEVTVALNVRDAVQLISMPLRIQFDREKLLLVSIEKGSFLAGSDASDIIFSRAIRQENGLAAVNISRYPGTGGADGEGELVKLTFKGLAAGESNLRIIATSPRGAENALIAVQPLDVPVLVQ